MPQRKSDLRGGRRRSYGASFYVAADAAAGGAIGSAQEFVGAVYTPSSNRQNVRRFGTRSTGESIAQRLASLR
jgi:hypothetical protein